MAKTEPFRALDKLPRRPTPSGGRVVMIPLSTKAKSVTGVIYGKAAKPVVKGR